MPFSHTPSAGQGAAQRQVLTYGVQGTGFHPQHLGNNPRSLAAGECLPGMPGGLCSILSTLKQEKAQHPKWFLVPVLF